MKIKFVEMMVLALGETNLNNEGGYLSLGVFINYNFTNNYYLRKR
jgi:hypothetical protein